MTQTDEKKSEQDTSQANDSLSTGDGLPDVQLVDSTIETKLALFPIVGIGASAGGVEALQRLFKSLPPARGIAYIVVVHLAPAHPSFI